MFADEGPNDKDVTVVCEQENWKWVRWETRELRPFISFHYRSKIWKKIGNRLKEVGDQALLDKFASGCFGHLLEWRENYSSGQATHAVVARQIILEGATNHELWFRVLGQNLRFGYREYALVTGLRFGPTDFNPNGWHDARNVGVYERFAGCAKISAKDLLSKFISGVDGATHDDYLKVANLIALYMFGLGYDCTKVIEDFAWVLVDNLDAWNIFPWGGYTYQALVYYVFQLARTKEECQARYHFFGPVWALQMWTYEAIPDLGHAAAVLDRPGRLPRCLKWAFKRPQVKNFDHYFNSELQRLCLQTLTPDANEERQEYWISVNGPNPLGVSYEEPFNETTARLQIEGPIRKSKLIQRSLKLKRRREEDEDEDDNVVDNIVTKVEELFKESMHAEAKKMIFHAWGNVVKLPPEDNIIHYHK